MQISNIPCDVLVPIMFSKCESVIISLLTNIISSRIPYSSLSIDENKLEKIVFIVVEMISIILLTSNILAPFQIVFRMDQ